MELKNKNKSLKNDKHIELFQEFVRYKKYLSKLGKYQEIESINKKIYNEINKLSSGKDIIMKNNTIHEISQKLSINKNNLNIIKGGVKTIENYWKNNLRKKNYKKKFAKTFSYNIYKKHNIYLDHSPVINSLLWHNQENKKFLVKKRNATDLFRSEDYLINIIENILKKERQKKLYNNLRRIKTETASINLYDISPKKNDLYKNQGKIQNCIIRTKFEYLYENCNFKNNKNKGNYNYNYKIYSPKKNTNTNTNKAILRNKNSKNNNNLINKKELIKLNNINQQKENKIYSENTVKKKSNDNKKNINNEKIEINHEINQQINGEFVKNKSENMEKSKKINEQINDDIKNNAEKQFSNIEINNTINEQIIPISKDNNKLQNIEINHIIKENIINAVYDTKIIEVKEFKNLGINNIINEQINAKYNKDEKKQFRNINIYHVNDININTKINSINNLNKENKLIHFEINNIINEQINSINNYKNDGKNRKFFNIEIKSYNK